MGKPVDEKLQFQKETLVILCNSGALEEVNQEEVPKKDPNQVPDQSL